MQLKEVTLTNFRSYKGVHTFKPRPGASFVLGKNTDEGYSSNGGGKTSLLSAIAWCLYGELATGATKDAVIHYGEPEVVVEARFEGLTVRRGKKRTKPESLEFFADELGGWVREDLDQTQNKLDSFLGVGKELFYNAFWLDNASKTVQFLFKRPAERLQVLQDLLGEGFFAQAKKAATSKRQDLDAKIAQVGNDIPWLEKQEKTSVSRIFDLGQQLEKEKIRIERADEERKRILQLIKDDVSKMTESMEILIAQRDQLAIKIDISPEEVIRNCALLEAQIHQAEEKFQKQYTGKRDDKCPTCLRDLETHDKVALETEKTKIFKEITRLKKLLEVEKKKKDELQRDKRKIDKMSSEIVELKVRKNAQESVLRQRENSYEEADASILVRLEAMIEKEESQLKDTREEKQNKLALLESLKEKIPYYRFWEEGFGSKGIQNLLLDDVRGLLSQFTRNYLANFSGEVLKVVYPKSDKGFEIVISYRDKETPVSNLSRGEVGRANMAVLLALRKMLLYMRKSRVDFIVLDDAVSDLDESGTQSIVDMAEALSREVGNVFVTVPQPIPTIKPDLLVRVEKKGGVSWLL